MEKKQHGIAGTLKTNKTWVELPKDDFEEKTFKGFQKEHLDELKKAHPWMNVDANIETIKKMGMILFQDSNLHLDGKGVNPYQETSDDCTGNLFKKKI